MTMYSYHGVGVNLPDLGKQFLWSRHFEGILSILSRIPLDSLPTLTWPTQTIHFPITDSTRLQFSCSDTNDENANLQVKRVKYLPVTHPASAN